MQCFSSSFWLISSTIQKQIQKWSEPMITSSSALYLHLSLSWPERVIERDWWVEGTNRRIPHELFRAAKNGSLGEKCEDVKEGVRNTSPRPKGPLISPWLVSDSIYMHCADTRHLQRWNPIMPIYLVSPPLDVFVFGFLWWSRHPDNRDTGYSNVLYYHLMLPKVANSCQKLPKLPKVAKGC